MFLSIGRLCGKPATNGVANRCDRVGFFASDARMQQFWPNRGVPCCAAHPIASSPCTNPRPPWSVRRALRLCNFNRLFPGQANEGTSLAPLTAQDKSNTSNDQTNGPLHPMGLRGQPVEVPHLTRSSRSACCTSGIGFLCTLTCVSCWTARRARKALPGCIVLRPARHPRATRIVVPGFNLRDFHPCFHTRRLMPQHVTVQQPFAGVIEHTGNIARLIHIYQCRVP